MKNKKKIFGIFLCLLILFISASDIIYALHQNVLIGYNQVTDIGGTNTVNNNGEIDDGISVSKTIEESNLENYFDITLTVNTTSKIEELITEPDLAIVIVMDISNTMNKLVDENNTRYESAMKAGEEFIKKFAEESVGTNAKRQLGYVSFNTDAHQTFELQEVKTIAKGDSLVETMKEKTSAIINKSGYGNTKKKYTNIEGGLKRAWDMLETTDVKNKYIILISDGFPTTYLIKNTDNDISKNEDYYGHEPYSFNVTESDEGVFANGNLKKPCSAGVDYSDRGAIKTSAMAENIKNDGINIMVVGTGIKNGNTIDSYLTLFENEIFSTVDSNTTNYEIGESDNTSSYISWLTNKIASDKKYYDSDNSSLTEAYLKIFDDIKKQLKIDTQATWVAEDPVGVEGTTPNIDFLGLYDDVNILHDSLDNKNENQSNTANYNDKEISWDLKNSDYYKTEVVNDITHYIYKIKYRIRIENESNTFNPETIYKTNGTTTLSYNVRENGIISSTKYIDFPIPEVVGYLGNFTFTKKSSFDNANLSGAKFKLTHSPDCACHNERKFASINDFIQVSDQNGTVTFNNIPSGHSYILTETEAPTDHILSTQKHSVVVSYGEVTGTVSDNIFINEINKGNLEIQKIVQGSVKNPNEFEFILEVKYKGNKINGTYNYKINDNKEGKINLDTGIIKLKKDDKIIIYDLPVGATYTLTETTTDGFKVEYKVNSNNLVEGTTATCNSSSSCKIEKGDVNKVKFINTANYILPATGSSSMLILIIIGTLLLGIPVIYIGNSFYKHIRNIA